MSNFSLLALFVLAMFYCSSLGTKFDIYITNEQSTRSIEIGKEVLQSNKWDVGELNGSKVIGPNQRAGFHTYVKGGFLKKSCIRFSIQDPDDTSHRKSWLRIWKKFGVEKVQLPQTICDVKVICRDQFFIEPAFTDCSDLYGSIEINVSRTDGGRSCPLGEPWVRTSKCDPPFPQKFKVPPEKPNYEDM